MSTVGEFRVPVAEFALCETFERVPDAEFAVERALPRTGDRVMVVLWAYRPDHGELQAAIDADPSVSAVRGLVDLDTEWLYQMDWIDGTGTLAPALADHDAALMSARGDREGWRLQLLVPERNEFAALAEACHDRGLTLNVERIYELDDRLDGRFGLSERQYEALALAGERGYFESPRETSAAELAAELGISQQAFSERLRRAIRNLVNGTITTDDPSAAFSYPDRWRTTQPLRSD
jgi:predicted DNA binding protein